MHPDDFDALQNKRICYVCVNEACLSREIEDHGDQAECSYCNKTVSTYSIGIIAQRVETAFEQHYYLTDRNPDDVQQMLMADRKLNYEFYRYGLATADAIENAGGFVVDAACDIQEILADKYSSRESDEIGEEIPFSADAHYSELDTNTRTWQEAWHQFEKSLHTEGRFFNRTAAAHLTAVFGGIDRLRTAEGNSLIVDVGPGCKIDHFYRGRVFQTEALLLEGLCRPDRHLGSPPANYAAAGRMNAQGISVFYGADSPSVAIAEVRPPVGSRVAVAKFNIIRRLRLLDLTALPDIYESGSIFDQTFAGRLERASFLRSLGKWMTRPVMPGEEAVNYLATQAVADFLATENDPVFDGILFPSVQAKDGRNVVLFHKAAGVEQFERPAGTRTRASAGTMTSEGFELDYTVYEAMPPTPQAPMQTNPWDTFVNLSKLHPGDLLLIEELLTAALRVDLASVMVHHVDWVDYHCTSFKVERHSYGLQDSNDLMAEPEF